MARPGVTIKNATRLETDGLRAVLYAAIDKTGTEGELRVTFVTYPRGRTRLQVSWGPTWLQLAIPNAMMVPERLREVRRTLGAYLLWALWQRRNIKRKADWGWGEQFPLALQPEGPKPTLADRVRARERKARELLARLEGELEALEAKRKILKARIHGARAKVKYYERRESKSVREADFLDRVKDKVRALEAGTAPLGKGTA